MSSGLLKAMSDFFHISSDAAYILLQGMTFLMDYVNVAIFLKNQLTLLQWHSSPLAKL